MKIQIMTCDNCGTKWEDDGGPGCPECHNDEMYLSQIEPDLRHTIPGLRSKRTRVQIERDRTRQAEIRTTAGRPPRPRPR